MNERKSYEKRLKSLSKGKVKKLGFLETLKFKISGYRDGKQGMPKASDERGSYTSPVINREVNAFEEFCALQWGAIQYENQKAYARMTELLDEIFQLQKSHEAAIQRLAAARADVKTAEPVLRKYGEEELSEIQVKSRRTAERNRYLASYRAKVNTLEDKIVILLEEFSKLHGMLTEMDNSTRLMCSCAKAHMLQRLDVYYRASLRKHPKRDTMPPALKVDIPFRSEQLYREPHEKAMKNAEKLYEQMRG